MTQVIAADAFLAHYGIKGMRWGHRKERTPTQKIDKEIKKLRKQNDRLDVEKYIEGLGYQGWAAGKVYKKKAKRNPEFAYKNLTPEQKRAYDKAVDRKAIGKIMRSGTLATGILAGGGTLLVKSAGLNPASTQGAMISVAVLASTAGRMTIHQVSAVHTARDHQNRLARIAELEKQRKALEPGRSKK